MLRWKTICWVSFTTACLRRTPERFLGLASAYAERQIMHHFAQGHFPDDEIFFYVDKCLRKNPVNDEQLEDYCNQKIDALKSVATLTYKDSIKSHLSGIDSSISKMVNTI